jgi:hypothetical protein
VLPESRRTPTFLYVDEAQEYFDDTIETILTQARSPIISAANRTGVTMLQHGYPRSAAVEGAACLRRARSRTG